MNMKMVNVHLTQTSFLPSYSFCITAMTQRHWWQKMEIQTSSKKVGADLIFMPRCCLATIKETMLHVLENIILKALKCVSNNEKNPIFFLIMSEQQRAFSCWVNSVCSTSQSSNSFLKRKLFKALCARVSWDQDLTRRMISNRKLK